MARTLSLYRDALMALLLTLGAGCAATPPNTGTPQGECRTRFTQLDQRVEQQQVRDHAAAQIAGFPYLRINRLLASLRHELTTPEQFDAWLARLAALDTEARHHELRNLALTMDVEQTEQQLAGCREQLIASELARPEMRQQLIANAEVADSYVTWWRVAGLYPLTAPFVSLGVDRWHNNTHKEFATPLAELPVTGRLIRWSTPRPSPLGATEVAAILRKRDPLGLPSPEAEELQQLFDTFAPIWEVDVASADDRIGTLGWHNGPQLDPATPRLYRLVSHTRFQGELLMQLNYIVWFAARPGDDIYAGRLDGINWRVTLASDGTPLLYDSIHNCGCYYQAFIGNRLRLRDDLPDFYYERPLLPQPAPEQLPPTLRIAATTHYLQRIYHEQQPTAAQMMVWDDYDTLRSLPAGDGYHSLFGEHGIVTESARRERYLLWPMGVRSPGAMRQWGQHAIAFVGRRHFDDAALLDTLFEPVTPP